MKGKKDNRNSFGSGSGSGGINGGGGISRYQRQQKGSTAYLILFHWPDTDKLKLKGVSLAGATLLTADGRKPVAVEKGNTLTGLAPEPPDAIATVIALDLK